MGKVAEHWGDVTSLILDKQVWLEGREWREEQYMVKLKR